MIEVSFRFYARLNDFLPAWRRGQRIRREVPSRSSVKDSIEALGVPHPEVDVILINGEPVDFTSHLCDGDRVSVYPRFQSIDLATVARAGADPPEPVRFALDVHLRKLASFLRLCGFDAVIVDEDAELVDTAGREARVVLTRDVGVLKRSVVRHGYWVRHTDPERQLAEVFERFDLSGRIEPFTRCLRCNTLLVPVEASAVATRLLPRTRAQFQHFHLCPGCNRVYWRGSHYERLARVLDRARTGRTSLRRAHS